MTNSRCSKQGEFVDRYNYLYSQMDELIGKLGRNNLDFNDDVIDDLYQMKRTMFWNLVTIEMNAHKMNESGMFRFDGS